MNENKPSTILDSDDDAPDLSSPEWREKLSRATARRGRPKAKESKVSTTLRLDRDIITYFQAGGRGWQTRINEALRLAMPPERDA
jgi:uncharacterized protein (DUF4415 family)